MTETKPLTGYNHEWEVYYQSKKSPGIEFYSGSYNVIAESDNEAIEKVYHLLRKSFSHRTKLCWEFYRVVQVA